MSGESSGKPTFDAVLVSLVLWVMGAAGLLIVNWFGAVLVLAGSCSSPYAGGNLTECVGGLSEERTNALAWAIALVLLAVEVTAIVLVRRRRRG
ncbi:hypothetical protein HII36_22765 [Nonomuraea sp. NN258]|uniref:hypothetical protein n=1 Tax=Nonomuraea antri TaxID=2730852 RepID=UPI00156A4A53|nr:hypothetical protein [Nonomuraea antri]NRQ34636.1 hypothetical protein [Nonomuraea antri]